MKSPQGARKSDNATGGRKVQPKKRAASAKDRPAAASGKAAADESAQAKARKSGLRKQAAKKRKRRIATARLYAPGPALVDEAALAEGLAGLRALDAEVVERMIAIGGPPPLRRREPGLEGLVWIIVSQQVSVASANAIAGRIRLRFPQLDAATLLAASEEDLRACGLSAPKMRTLRALAAAIHEGALDLDGLAALPPAQAHDRLVAVKGIGPWTADIFLLFCLGHPDAWPAGDLALQEAAKLVLGLRKRPDAAGLERIGERWRPWRGVAARLLWASYKGLKARSGMALEG